jgi:hypothetical protein
MASSGSFGQGQAACRHSRCRQVSRHHLEGQGLEGISSQNRCGLIKLSMACWFASPQIIVVHCGQVIVNQRIRMDHFHGTGSRQGYLPIAPSRFGCQQHQQRSQALPRS